MQDVNRYDRQKFVLNILGTVWQTNGRQGECSGNPSERSLFAFLVGQKINTLQITIQRIQLVYSVVYRWIIDTENA